MNTGKMYIAVPYENGTKDDNNFLQGALWFQTYQEAKNKVEGNANYLGILVLDAIDLEYNSAAIERSQNEL